MTFRLTNGLYSLRRARDLRTCCAVQHTCSKQYRGIVQSNNNGVRSIIDQAEDQKLIRKLRMHANGNYYRHQQKLWPSPEALERELTELNYSPVERSPLTMLPQRNAPKRVFACEGRGATALLDCVEQEEASGSSALTSSQDLRGDGAGGAIDLDFMEDLLSADHSIANKIMTSADVEGTTIGSARERAREIVEADLSVNTLVTSSRGVESSNVAVSRVVPSAGDAAGASWASLGLDPALSDVAAALHGPVPSRLQARLLPAFLNEDHNDVLFNGVTGSGKTSAMLLALLQGIRAEAAGFNVLVTSNSMTAMQAHDAIRAICRRGGGGALVDRPEDDYSWMFLGTYREDYEKYYRLLTNSLTRSPHGPVRLLITTADVFCQLLFEKKMEFEKFGYLRRVYVDDIGAQIPMLDDHAGVAEVRERLRNPVAAELLLGTLHQQPGPHIRSILQLGMVSADVDGRLKDHLKALCIKPAAHTVVLSPVRVPSTIHCLFTFHLQHEEHYAYTAKLIWNARDTIPGRAILFVRDDEDVLRVRRTLRGLGMNAKIFSEVYANSEFKEKWKFLILKESEAFGVDVPLVSHVFITFAPRSWQSFQHMCGRTGRLGNVGWVYTIADKREAKQVRQIADAMDVDFTHHVVDQNLQQLPAEDMDRLTRDPALYGMDPQYAVQQHYEQQADNPDMAYRSREFFSKPAIKQFQMEDYTPVSARQRRFENASKLARDVETNPGIVEDLMKKGLLDEQMKPTKRLRTQIDMKSLKVKKDKGGRPSKSRRRYSK